MKNSGATTKKEVLRNNFVRNEIKNNENFEGNGGGEGKEGDEG